MLRRDFGKVTASAFAAVPLGGLVSACSDERSDEATRELVDGVEIIRETPERR
jgi:hypothetical protein